jgi:hypothetical protein
MKEGGCGHHIQFGAEPRGFSMASVDDFLRILKAIAARSIEV